MSHRKYEAPRHGSLQFMPRRRSRRAHGKIRHFPKDDPSLPCHLTAFMAYKAGMTHIVRDVDLPGSKMNKREVVEAVTVLETPPMIVVGLCGYIPTIRGLRCVKTVWAKHISEEVRRKYVRNWYRSKKKAFTVHMKKALKKKGKENFENGLKKIANMATIVRVIAHTQIKKVGLRQKKAHMMEIQINGGTIKEKVEFGKSLMEKQVPINSVFKEDECLDIITITTGHGFEDPVTRFGVRIQQHKSRKGIRKVACIGAFHPTRVAPTVARAGQKGFHHRTELNKKIYRLGVGDKRNASTEYDTTKKPITPMGGFPHYGIVDEDFIILKGCIAGPRKRVTILRRSMFPPTSKWALEKTTLKFIDTSSKFGHGRFQTVEEKKRYIGKTKVRIPIAA